MKILYVEDDEGFQDIVKKKLDRTFGDNSCLIVPTMAQYENVIKGAKYVPDVILMDILLPKDELGDIVADGGFQLIEKGLHKSVPVIILSMWNPPENSDKDWKGLDYKGYFKKPLNYEKLIRVIRESAACKADQCLTSTMKEVARKCKSGNYSTDRFHLDPAPQDPKRQKQNHPEPYAVAQIRDFSDGKRLIVKTAILLQAGIQQANSSSGPLDYDMSASAIESQKEKPTIIDIAVRAEDMEVDPWIRHFEYQPKTEVKLIDFELTPQSVGKKEISVEFYYNRHWLTQIQFNVEIEGLELAG